MPKLEAFQPVPNIEAGRVEIAPGFELYREVHQHLKHFHGFNVDVTVTWSDEHAQLQISRLDVQRIDGGGPITAEGLRAFALRGLVRRSFEASTRDRLTPSRLRGDQQTRAFGLIDSDQAEECRAAGPVPETLRAVGLIYRGAAALGDSPTKAVRDVFRVSQSTAGGWVAAARKAGHLGQSEGPGKASV